MSQVQIIHFGVVKELTLSATDHIYGENYNLYATMITAIFSFLLSEIPETFLI